MGQIKLGDLQLAILHLLWERPARSVAEVCQQLAPERVVAVTTVATVLSRLERQGIVERVREDGVYVYSPVVTERQVRRSMVAELVEHVFKGDAGALVHHLLREEEVDREELVRLEAIIEDADR